MSQSRFLRLSLASVAGLAVAALIAWLQVGTATKTAPPPPAVGGPFELVDHSGKTVRDADYRGKHLLIYFGYTYCPDVCPTELAVMSQALDRLSPAVAAKVQPLFISIDPERDGPAHLADYVALFHPRLIGLTGTPAQVAVAVKAYRVYAAKAPGWEKAGKDYLMDHSSFIYWMDETGRFAAAFPAGTSPDAVAARLNERLGG
jgi:cytochrome oxidase Cu insertion factor (SCO1/SenC/PrrC family)